MKIVYQQAFALVALVAVILAPGRAGADQPVTAERQMVVAANPHAAQAGIRILREGGSAVDAAIAVQLVLGLVEPQSSGIGGGAFMLYYAARDADGADPQLTAYEGRETAPAAATPDMFLDEDGDPLSFAQAGFGGLAVGVPGVLRMFEMAHRDHGRLPWRDLFAPAIELAEKGFEISPRLHYLLDRFKRIASAKEFEAYFYDADGEPYPVGHRLVNREYAATLRMIASEGADAMYVGPLAEAIVAKVHDNALKPGRLALGDLQSYRAHKSAPLCSPYRGWRVCGPPLPSSGGITTQQILGILEPFDLSAMRNDPVETIHLFAEASRLAYADRNLYLGDPAFVDVPVDALLRADYLQRRAALIDPDRAMDHVSAGNPRPSTAWRFAAGEFGELPSTSHFSIVDKWDDAVSMTTSVQGAFGSQLMVGGFILNNELTDFSFAPERGGMPVANRPESGKHPLSSMTPTLVLDDRNRVRMIVGSPGGTRIISFVAQTIVGVLDGGLNIQDAVAAPHYVDEREPLELEQRTDVLQYADALRKLGHDVAPRSLNSGLHGIVIDYTDDGKVLRGGVDPRREGEALGD
jgi:gamma-glutamyltranspeptidase/glutathione hydrolase